MLRERVAALQWGWVSLGSAGVLLVANPSPKGFNPAVLFPIASSAAWGAAMILTRRVARSDSAFTTQTYSCGIGLAALTALLPWGFEMPTHAQLVELAAMAACWAGAQWLVAHAYGRSEASRIAPFAYSQLLWANLLSVVLLGQSPATHTAAGTAVIAIAGLGAARSAGSRASEREGPLLGAQSGGTDSRSGSGAASPRSDTGRPVSWPQRSLSRPIAGDKRARGKFECQLSPRTRHSARSQAVARGAATATSPRSSSCATWSTASS